MVNLRSGRIQNGAGGGVCESNKGQFEPRLRVRRRYDGLLQKTGISNAKHWETVREALNGKCSCNEKQLIANQFLETRAIQRCDVGTFDLQLRTSV